MKKKMIFSCLKITYLLLLQCFFNVRLQNYFESDNLLGEYEEVAIITRKRPRINRDYDWQILRPIFLINRITVDREKAGSRSAATNVVLTFAIFPPRGPSWGPWTGNLISSSPTTPNKDVSACTSKRIAAFGFHVELFWISYPGSLANCFRPFCPVRDVDLAINGDTSRADVCEFATQVLDLLGASKV